MVGNQELEYAGSGLKQETNWWGAFVIGLAGTILVTGIAPVMITKLGAASIPSIVLITVTGVILCLLLAELSAMMPERSGGSPSYAYPAWRIRFPRLAPHVNGITAWSYWLGWFPVAPLNMILASIYIGSLAGVDLSGGFAPISTFIPWFTLGVAIVGIILFFIPAYVGIRLGTAFTTILGVISMIPLTFVAIGWIFNVGDNFWGDILPFNQLDGTSFVSDAFGHGWFTIYIAFSFLLTWNVIAMEAAACYIGETKDPDRDAKIAMSLEGVYGLFIYALVPVSFILVIGADGINEGADILWDPNTIFVTFPVPALLPANQHTRRPPSSDALQRPRLARRRPHGGHGRDLHVLERGLSVLVPARAAGVLHAAQVPAAQVPARRSTAVPAPRLVQVRRARSLRLLRVHLLLRGADLRGLRVLAGREEHLDLQHHRDRDAVRLHPALPVPDAGGRSASACPD